MKKKDHKLSQLKHNLFEEKRKSRGKEFVVWRLNPDEVEYLRRFTYVEPYMYKINKAFRPGYSIKTAPQAVKRVFYAKKSPAFLVMNEKDVADCRNAGLNPIPYKFKVHLNTFK